MKRIIFLLVIIFAVLSASAQQEGTIKGEMADGVDKSDSLRSQILLDNKMTADGENISRLINEYLQDRGNKGKKDTMDKAMWSFIEAYKESHKEQSANIFCFLAGFSDETFDIARADSLLVFFNDLQDNEDIDAVRQFVAGNKCLRIGSVVSELTMQSPDGTTVRLTDFVGRGHIVLIDFWASWCLPCCAEVPNLKAAYDRFHDKGFDIVSISLDDKKEAWTSAIARLGMPWHHISDLRGWESEAVKAYSLNAIPQTILVSSDGKVIDNNLRGEEIMKAVEKAMAARP